MQVIGNSISGVEGKRWGRIEYITLITNQANSFTSDNKSVSMTCVGLLTMVVCTINWPLSAILTRCKYANIMAP